MKDMQAITYQFITLRDMGQQRVERIINQLGKQDVELKIICSNIDFALNVGDLKGNYFEIMVRNLKRIKVDQRSLPFGETDASEYSEESFVDCDSVHINQMVERIKKHGFINFYGEQRIGHPGSSEQVGVMGFEIGQAMLRQDYMGAIKLLMEGTRHRENDDVRRVRQAWKDSNGDPSTTIKAFGNADIMPRERAVLRGLKRYPNNPLESIRFLSHQMRMFYINAYQSYIFNQVASQRIKLYGDTVIKGDIYFDTDGDHCRDSVKIVSCNEVPPIEITQVVLPLPGHDVQYPVNDIGQLYKDLLVRDNIKFEKNSVAESTAKGSYRKLIVHPGKLNADIVSSDPACSMKLSFELPKGCYATMLLRELMVTTVIRSK
jgi:tRNA pseudouridine13 synthase